MQKENLWKRHRLRLVTSSLQCDFTPRAPRTPLQAVVDGDAMAADVPSVIAMGEIFEKQADTFKAPSQTAETIKDVESTQTLKRAEPSNPAEIVAMGLSSAAAAAAAAAKNAAGSVYSAAIPVSSPVTSNISAFTSSFSSPMKEITSQLDVAQNEGVVNRDILLNTSTAGCDPSPTEWYIADDEEENVRYFVLQGSDNIDHWRVNLTFDPVPFEDPSLGIKVHRGVYETAKQFYDRFLPLVKEHIASTGGKGRIAFTGHSLGGSLGTLLALMYVYRKALKPEEVAPVYTFGAPAIFCEGCPSGCCDIGSRSRKLSNISMKDSYPGESKQIRSTEVRRGILDLVGLSQDHIRNVLMHKDIVPRAFACDYSLVAELLRAVGGSFRDHDCLKPGEHRMLFNFVGNVMILQPDVQGSFVAGEGYHPMLPSRPGLYLLRSRPRSLTAPSVSTSPSEKRSHTILTGANKPGYSLTKLPLESTATMNVSENVIEKDLVCQPQNTVQSFRTDKKDSKRPKMNSQTKNRVVVQEVKEAIWHFMNTPHPLDTLADPGAYGDAGSISRYHNPDNYTKALGTALRVRGSAWQRIATRADTAGVKWRSPSTNVGVKSHLNSKQISDSHQRKGGKACLAPVHHHN